MTCRRKQRSQAAGALLIRILAVLAAAVTGCQDSPNGSAGIIPSSLSVDAAVPRTVITSEPSCSRCRLTLERVVRLGGASGPQGLGGTGRIVSRDSRGLYYVVDKNTAAREVFVFSADGRYLRSIGGRRGEGPGEHRFISQLFVIPGDSLRLHDAALARYTIIDPEHEFVRTERYVPVGYLSTLLLPEGGMITNGPHIPGLSTKEARGKPNLPIHIIDAKGMHIRSFGLERTDTVPTRNTVLRSLTLSPDGRLYAGHSQAYVIEVWDTLGVKQRELVRDAKWFRPWETQPALATRLPQHPYLETVGWDEGRLWTLSRVMQDGWERHVERAPPRDGEPNGRSILGGVTMNDVYDTIVEVIDPVSGRLVFSQRFDLWIYRLLDDGLVVTDGEDENLISYVDIWRLKLVEP